MNTSTQRVARFGLLTALALVLGLLDRAIPLTALLGGAAPGIKLGLANTVLLYAVYLMDWPSAVLLMLTKVILSGFLFGSLTAILYSLSGGVLSLWVVILIGIACIACLAAWIAIRKGSIRGVPGTSIAGAIAHNIGQVLAASAVLRTPQLMTTYLPVLIGVGAAVGSLTGIVAERVFRALHINPEKPGERKS